MRLGTFRREECTLVDAEAMLFINQDKTQILKLHAGREQGMRADGDGKRPVGGGGFEGTPFRRGGVTRE